MPALHERLADEGELLTFADTEPIQALQAILEQRPRLIVLERLFAATPRGAALINRIKTDPQVSHAEVRVMSHTGDYSRQVAKPSKVEARRRRSPAAAESREHEPTTRRLRSTSRHGSSTGTARGARRAIACGQGVEIQLDGNPASVVDLSVVGAQVISSTILRPNQRVRDQHADRRFRDAVPRRRRVGEVRAAQADRAAALPRRRRVRRRRRRRRWTSTARKFKV